mgnify:CR=1 FL=1
MSVDDAKHILCFEILYECFNSKLYLQVLNYSTSIFKSVGLVETDAQYATLGTSGAIVVMTIVSVLFMDRIGRRPLHLGGLSGCLLSMIMITVAFFLQV